MKPYDNLLFQLIIWYTLFLSDNHNIIIIILIIMEEIIIIILAKWGFYCTNVLSFVVSSLIVSINYESFVISIVFSSDFESRSEVFVFICWCTQSHD